MMSFKDRYLYLLLKDETVNFKHAIAFAEKMPKSHRYDVYDFNVRTGEQRRIKDFNGGK